MTTELQAEILLAALREWPGRWRRPGTAVALGEGSGAPSVADLSRAFLDDLSRLDTALTACRRLIALGEFDTVAHLLAEESLTPAERSELAAERDRAAARCVADTRYRLASLRRRAELTGRPLQVSPARLEEQAARSYPPVAAALAEAERQAASAERDAVRELWGTATAAAAVGTGDTARWLEEVRTSLGVGDLAEARRLLAGGPGEPDLRPHDGDRVSGLDEHGTALATALRALDDHITEHTALDFVKALADFTGTAAPSYEVHSAPGGVLVVMRSTWPDLPGWLALPNADGLTLWVAPGDRPPAAAPPLAWIVPGTQPGGSPAPRGFARITGDQLLHLALTATGPPARLRGLLTLVCSQLDALDVLNPDSRPLPAPDITDLLDLLGLPANPALAAALRYETGGRPRLIVELLSVVRAAPGLGTISAETVQQVRQEWWPRAFEALLALYRDDHADLLLLVALAFHADEPDGFSLEDLRKGIAAVAADEEAAAHLASIPGLPAAAERLVHDGFFQRRAGGGYTLPDDGVRYLLPPAGPEGTGVQRAQDAAAAACRRHLAVTAERRAEIGALVIRMISHMLSGTMSAIRTELTLMERARGQELSDSLARVRRYADPGQTLDEQFQRAMRPPESCALGPLLHAIGEDQSWRSQGVVRVDLRCPADVHVMANKWLLSQAFVNMLDNARLAIGDTAAEFGTIRIIATADAAGCAVEISDSGCGLTEVRRRELEARQPVPSARGRGVGVLHSRWWFESFEGTLEILRGNSALGGAWFRVRLPRCEAPPE